MAFDDDETRVPDDGVRIIGADEAAERISSDDVAHRRRDDEPRFGDRPEEPASRDTRPTIRFPLAADEVPRSAAAASQPFEGSDDTAMPHWTEPPTGEVPAALRGPEAEGSGGESQDDLDAWSTLATAGPRWRDSASDWDEPDYDAEAMSHDDDTRIGALDETERPAADDFFGFEEVETVDAAGGRVRQADPDGPLTRGHEDVSDQYDSGSSDVRTERPDADPATRVVRTGLRSRATADRDPADPHPLRNLPDRDVGIAVATGAALAVAALVLLSLGPAWAMVLVTGVLVVAAAELYSALQRGGYQPATLLGLVATGALVLASYWKGETAIPLVVGLTVIATLLWYLVGVTRNQPTMNVAVSLFVVLYVGLLGSFAALILTFPNEHGVGVLIAVVLAVVANDVGALVVGRQWGHARLAPDISPNKTVEGLLGGAVATIVVTTVAVGIIGWEPFDGIGQALALGLVVAVVAPLGDLCESMIKRDLGLKDMGSVLPGHGGLLDRFDALLFALPAAYYLCRLLDIF